MDTALPQKFPFILDRNLAKAKCTGNRACTSCDTVVLGVNVNTPVKGKLVITCPLQEMGASNREADFPITIP